jgi:hypothetical protein
MGVELGRLVLHKDAKERRGGEPPSHQGAQAGESILRGVFIHTKTRRQKGKAGGRAGERVWAFWTREGDFPGEMLGGIDCPSMSAPRAGFTKSVFTRSNQTLKDAAMVLPVRTIAPALRPAFPLCLCVLVLNEPIRHDTHRPLTGSARLRLSLVPLCLGGEPDSPGSPRRRAGGPSSSAGRGRR